MEDKKFLQYFDQLIETKESQIIPQRSAIFKIVQVLSKSIKKIQQQNSKLLDKKYQYGPKCFSDLSYTLTRFIKGIASLNPAVKQGFYLGYTVICSNFKKYISVQMLLKTIVFAMKRLPQAMKPSQNCHRLIGQILLIKGLIEGFYNKNLLLNIIAPQGQIDQGLQYEQLTQTYKLINSQLADVYRQNYLNVLGKRGGQTSTVSLLWEEVVQSLFERCLSSKGLFQKVLNDLNDRIQGIKYQNEQKTQNDNRILWQSAWVSSKFMIILKSQTDLQHKIPLTTLPFNCDDPIQIFCASNLEVFLSKFFQIIRREKLHKHKLPQAIGKYVSTLGYQIEKERIEKLLSLILDDEVFNISSWFPLRFINNCLDQINAQFQQKQIKQFKIKSVTRLLSSLFTDAIIQKISNFILFKSKEQDSQSSSIKIIENLTQLVGKLKQHKQGKVIFNLLTSFYTSSKHFPLSQQGKPLLISICKGISNGGVKAERIGKYFDKEYQKLNKMRGNEDDSQDQRESKQKQFNYQLNKILILSQYIIKDNSKIANLLTTYCSQYLSESQKKLNLRNVQLCFTKLPLLCQNN